MAKPELSALIIVVRDEYLSKHKMRPYDINDGCCDSFAHEVITRYLKLHGQSPNENPPEPIWLAQKYHSLPNYKDLLDHCVIQYAGHYFDAEIPDGVPAVCPRLVPVWRNAGDRAYHEKMQEEQPILAGRPF